MQTLLHVHCITATSLRESVAKDHQLEEYGFEVLAVQKPGRKPGWAKLRSIWEERKGSLNLEWDGAARVMQVRVVNRGAGRPHLVVGDFIDYLLARHPRRIRAIVIVPGLGR